MIVTLVLAACVLAPVAMGGLEELPPPLRGDAAPYESTWNATFDPPNRVEEAGEASPAVAVTDNTVFLLRHEVEDGTERVHPIVEARSLSNGARLWKRDLLRGPDFTLAGVAAKADGSRVYVGGTTHGGSGDTITVFAFDGQSGATLWQSNQQLNAFATARALLLSPDESALYVAGSGAGDDRFAGRLAASNGARAWWLNVPMPTGSSSATITTAALSVDGATLYVGGSAVRGTDDLYVVAISTATAGTRWTLVRDTRAAGEPWRSEGVDVMRPTPDGQRLVVGGWVLTRDGDATSVVSLNAQTGEHQWSATLPYYVQIGISVSRDAKRVHTAGISTETWTATTLTLAAPSGTPLWARTLEGFTPYHPIVEAGRGVVLVATNDFSSPISTARLYTLDSKTGDARAEHAYSPDGRGASVFSAGLSRDALRLVLAGETGPFPGDGLMVWGFGYTGLPLPEVPASLASQLP